MKTQKPVALENTLTIRIGKMQKWLNENDPSHFMWRLQMKRYVKLMDEIKKKDKEFKEFYG